MHNIPRGVRHLAVKVGAHLWPNFGKKDIRSLSSRTLTLAFEPDASVSYQLAHIVRAYARHPDLIWVIPAAVNDVASSGGLATFHRFGESSVLNSLMPAADWKDIETDSQRVPVVRLEDVLQRFASINVIDLFVDAQGSDFDVVLSAGNLLHRVRSAILEVRSFDKQSHTGYQGQLTKEEGTALLRGHGFELVDCNRTSNDPNQLWKDEEDCLYFRSSIRHVG
eukprot:TRINITY_DN39655_c0_g1_i1.p1 TRINITY_DN39655_c0_g1~~TRINITY_DN39655_c0_g1_i1.p1  ORF type:complete len:258 (-),score=19.84 TRINITY_DN39655_c0_g1_i1:71-739(-)